MEFWDMGMVMSSCLSVYSSASHSRFRALSIMASRNGSIFFSLLVLCEGIDRSPVDSSPWLTYIGRIYKNIGIPCSVNNNRLIEYNCSRKQFVMQRILQLFDLGTKCPHLNSVFLTKTVLITKYTPKPDQLYLIPSIVLCSEKVTQIFLKFNFYNIIGSSLRQNVVKRWPSVFYYPYALGDLVS